MACSWHLSAGNGRDWGYALIWFLLNDRVKLLAYRVFEQDGRPAALAIARGGHTLHAGSCSVCSS